MTKRRLIEEYLPVAAVSEEAASEKIGGRLGHISTLHLWWARRPLAAARAAVYSALVGAPDVIDREELETFFRALCKWTGSSSAIERARREVLASQKDGPPKVLDMFAGGGAIPLEAARLGCEATALELNPVAHLIELCGLKYPQEFGPSLARDVDYWGRKLIEAARSELAEIYPMDTALNLQTTIGGPDEAAGATPIAYLWTRTVRCPNPAEAPHTVPLARQTWLAKKSTRIAALRVVPDARRMKVEYEVVRATDRASLGFDPGHLSERGSTTCPLCGASVPLEYVVGEAAQGRLSAEIMAAAIAVPGRGKNYVGSTEARKLVPNIELIEELLTRYSTGQLQAPREHITTGGLGVRVPRYGMTSFADLFSERQLVLLLTLSRLAQEAHSNMIEEGVTPNRAQAIATYLGLLIDRVADRSSTLCRWDSSPSYEGTTSTFAKQTLSMTWDYSEANPFGGASGDISGQLAYIVAVIERSAEIANPVRVIRGSALDLPFADEEFDAIVSDPPYYDNVGYADVSDYYYVWLKRSVGHLYPEHFAGELTPKRNEIVASPDRHESVEAAKRAYEQMMADAFREARRVLKPEGIFVCVYAHQTTAGWSTMIQAVREAGFTVLEAWPVDTEMSVRDRARNSAALASSIFLVARPRTDDRTGDWAHEVRPELQEIVSTRVGELAELGITGTDLVIAGIGAGMRAFTRYASVEKPNGEELAPDEYLEEVEREVAEAVLARIFVTDRGGLGRVDQETQFYVMGRFEFGDAFAPWDELNTLARGTGVELRELVNGGAPLLAFGNKRSEARLCDYRDRGAAIELERSTIDHLHRLLWLADNEPTTIKDYLEMAKPDSSRLRLVAHALSRPGLDSSGVRGAEADACERLLGVWKRLVEDNLFTAGSA